MILHEDSCHKTYLDEMVRSTQRVPSGLDYDDFALHVETSFSRLYGSREGHLLVSYHRCAYLSPYRGPGPGHLDDSPCLCLDGLHVL